jgi:DNA-binding NarL/FixJ family response regulator
VELSVGAPVALSGSRRELELVPRRIPIPVVVASPKLWNWSSLRRCLPRKSGYLLVDAFQAAEDVMLHCRRLSPCVLIAEPELLESLGRPEFSGVVDFGRAVQVLVYGSRQDDRTVQKLVRMGCMGFVDENDPPSVLRKAVQALASGEMWIERRLLTRVLQQLLFASRSPKLTPREKDVLRLIARGYKNRAIAERLSISHETVRWHIRSLHSKLGLQDRLGTALYAQQYLEPETPPSSAAGAELTIPAVGL